MMEQEPLSAEEAHTILEPYFIAARGIFVIFCEHKGLKCVSKTMLECSPEMHDTPRHFAGAAVDGKKIYVAPEMAELPEDNVAAIFAHEFGHIVDHLNPGRFFMIEEELVLVDDGSLPRDKRGDQTRIARMRRWEARDDDEVELVADQIAEQAVGTRIGYSGPCMLQGLNRGTPRPRGLR